MRTKHILFSMALGATLAACTAEEEFKVADNGNSASADLSIRPVIGTEFVLGEENPTTRMAVGDGENDYRPEWGEGDRLGAAIIDMAKYTSADEYETQLETVDGDVVKLYGVVESYGCNNAYTTADGTSWSAQYPLVEGNYLFYAPYNENLTLRYPLSTRVPMMQDGTEEKSALDEFYQSDNVVQVAYRFLKAGETQRPSITMYNIYAYPMFTITNNFDGYLFDNSTENKAGEKYSGAITVDSIEFVKVNASYAVQNDVVIGGVLKHGAEWDASGSAWKDAYAATKGLIFNLKHKDDGFNANGKWWDADEMLKNVRTADLLDDGNLLENDFPADSEEGTAGVITTVRINKELAKGGSYKVYCVMPASQYDFTSNQLMAKVYVTINNEQYILYKASLTGASENTWNAAGSNIPGYVFDAAGNPGLYTLTFMAGQRFPAEEIGNNNGSYFHKDGVKPLLNINLGGEYINAGVLLESEYTGIKTTEDLVEFISNAANGTKFEENATDGEDAKGFKFAQNHTAEITSAVIDALYANNTVGEGAFKLTASVLPISADVKVKSVDLTAGSKYIELESASGKSYKIELKDDIVAENSATGAGKYAVYSSGVTPSAVNEKSVVILNADATVIGKIKSLQIVSGATATVNSELTVSGDIRNEGTMTVSAKIANGEGREFVNNATINVNAAAAEFTVIGGEGTIKVPEANIDAKIKVAEGAKQEVVFVSTDGLDAAAVGLLAEKSIFNSIEEKEEFSLTNEDLENLSHIESLKLIGSGTTAKLTLSEQKVYDLSGITITVTANWTIEGQGRALTTVNGANIVVNEGTTLTLKDIAVNGTVEDKTEDGDGITLNNATWNGGTTYGE